MSSIITLSSKHVVANGYNNTLKYDLPYSGVNFSNHEIAIAKLQIYNSQYNINSNLYGNNTFSLIIPTAATTSTLVITLPDGYYSYADINTYIQSKLVTAGAYLIDGSGNNIFYMNMSANATYYSCQIDFVPVPIALPAGYTKPATGLYAAAGTGLPSSTLTMQIVVPTGLGSVIGFTVASYPPSALSTTQSYLSNITPQINPVSSYLIRCSMINNRLSLPSDIMSSFTNRGTSIGSLIDVSVPELIWLDLSSGSYTSFNISITDQLDRMVKFQDNQILLQLLIREKAGART